MIPAVISAILQTANPANLRRLLSHRATFCMSASVFAQNLYERDIINQHITVPFQATVHQYIIKQVRILKISQSLSIKLAIRRYIC